MTKTHHLDHEKHAVIPTASNSWKWYILFLTCFVTLGGYYSFDFPSALHGQLYRHFLASNAQMTDKDFEFQFGLAYSVYSLPNTVLPWLGGIAVDKIGNKTVMILAGTLVLLGNIVQTAACYSYHLPLFLFGRFIFGLGAETLTVTVNTYLAKWFHGQELAFALSINLSACKLGGVLTAWGSPYFAQEYSVNTASLSVSLLCLASFVLSLVLYVQEPWYRPPHFEHGKKLPSEKLPVHQHSPLNSYQSVHLRDDESQHDDGTLTSKASTNHRYAAITQHDKIDSSYHNIVSQHGAIEMSALVSSASVDAASTFDKEDGRSQRMQSSSTSGSVTGNGTVGGCYLNFSQSVWLVFWITFIMYGTFIPFSNISNAVIMEVYFPAGVIKGSLEYQDNEVKAAKLQSIPYFLTVFINPFIGIAIDWFGQRTFLLLLSTLCLVSAHLFIYTAWCGAIVPLLMIGLSFSVFGSVSWPCIPLIVSEEHHGTAYGLMGAFQNAAQSLIPLVLSQTYHETSSYRACELVLAGFASLGLLVGGYLWFVDEYYEDAVLRKP